MRREAKEGKGKHSTGARCFQKSLLILSSLLAGGLAVPAIHMLKATPETPISSAI